jgi:hypothetical protein
MRADEINRACRTHGGMRSTYNTSVVRSQGNNIYTRRTKEKEKLEAKSVETKQEIRRRQQW